LRGLSRIALLLILRGLALFLAVEVADTPIFCFDEWSGDASRELAVHQEDGSSLQHGVTDDDSGSTLCFCPCHLSFESVARFAFSATTRRTQLDALTDPDTSPVPAPSLDHPPQNLA